MAQRKVLINIRGASASGKTTCVKQFCERRGFRVEKIEAPFSALPVSVLSGGKIVVLGDYSANGNCLGVDRYENGKRDIIDCIMEVAITHNPEIIIYEHMLGSNTCNGTKEISDVASAFGYEYYGIYFSLSDEKRLKNLYARSGKQAGTKKFDLAKKRTERSAEMLNELGLRVVTCNVENIKKEEMWEILENAINEALK